VKAHYEFDWPGAEREYLRALDLNPNDAYAHVFYSNSYLSPHGRHAEAIDEMQKAIAIDPFSAPVESFLGRTYIWSREYDKAMANCGSVPKCFPDSRLTTNAWLSFMPSRAGLTTPSPKTRKPGCFPEKTRSRCCKKSAARLDHGRPARLLE
jgi:tetratricopeptide (TPR) repeat protein